MTRPDPMPSLLRAAAAQALPDQPLASFRALDAAAGAAIGHILFTVLAHHKAAGQSQRCYTNMPEAYPVGGRKPVTDSPWMQQVMFRGEPYIGRTREDIAEVFFDYELIWSLGCESVLNVPVRWRGETLGTLNLLHRAGWYNEGDLAAGRMLAALAVPAMLAVPDFEG